jgi:hypothetical protein
MHGVTTEVIDLFPNRGEQLAVAVAVDCCRAL